MQHAQYRFTVGFFDIEVEGPAPHQILNPAYQELGGYQGQQDLRCVYSFDKSSSWILSQIKKQTLSITESWYSMVMLAINEERWIIRDKVAKWPRSVSWKMTHCSDLILWCEQGLEWKRDLAAWRAWGASFCSAKIFSKRMQQKTFSI